jgi:broad specificity phosphatase PhoE
LAKLLLVRHGETALNSSQRFWGKTDVGLGPQGLQQAERLRDRLANEKIDFAYSSQLKRTVTTAETVVSIHNIKVVQCPQLNEIDFGDMEGLDFNEINNIYPEVARMWKEHTPGLRYPNGESLFEMEERVREFRTVLAGRPDSETILIVAHSGILRTLICQILGLDMVHRWSLRLDLASLSVVETYSQAAVLSLFNDISHLAKRSV